MIGVADVAEQYENGTGDKVRAARAVVVMIACVLRKPTGLPVGKQHG